MPKEIRNKVGPWVVGEDFFNRQLEVERFTELIDDGNNLLLVAPRRVGKTSLVRESFRRLEERGRDYPLFVDVQDGETPQDVIVALAMAAQPHRKLASKIRDAFSAFFRTVANNVESVGTGEILEIRLREGLAGDWRAKGTRILDHLAEADRPIVICFDELPVMINRLLRDGGTNAANRRGAAEVFLSWLRRSMSEHTERIRWVVCGSIGLEPILARHNLSSTVAHLRAFHLPPWDRQTADACLSALAAHDGIEWSGSARSALLDRLGYFIPHHIQMYYGHVMDECRLRKIEKPSASIVERVYETHMLSTRGHAEMADYEERLLRVLDRSFVGLALDLLTEAAVRDVLNPEAASLLAKRHPLENAESARRDVVRVLEHDGYLSWSDDLGGWTFLSPLMRDWWRKRFGQSHVPLVEET